MTEYVVDGWKNGQIDDQVHVYIDDCRGRCMYRLGELKNSNNMFSATSKMHLHFVQLLRVTALFSIKNRPLYSLFQPHTLHITLESPKN